MNYDTTLGNLFDKSLTVILTIFFLQNTILNDLDRFYTLCSTELKTKLSVLCCNISLIIFFTISEVYYIDG